MQPKRPDAARSPLDRVEEGMDVRDATGDTIGTVRDVYLGAPEAISGAPGDGARDRSADPRSDTPLERLAAAVSAADPLPAEVVQRLRQHGFIVIDSTGLLASDRYATAEQIASVSGNAVHLSVTRDDLLAA